MRYFVIMPTGERYGPADVDTLNLWVDDRRLFADSMLEQEGTGQRIQASHVPGLRFGPATPAATTAPYAPPAPVQPYAPVAPMTPPAPGQPYASPGYTPSATPHDTGAKEMWASFGFAVAAPIVGFFLIYGIFLGIAGVGSAWRAFQKGQKLALLGIVLNVIAIGLAAYMRFVVRYRVATGG